MSEREFWLEMRRAALTFARAIEARYGTSRPTPHEETLFHGVVGGAQPVTPTTLPDAREVVHS